MFEGAAELGADPGDEPFVAGVEGVRPVVPEVDDAEDGAVAAPHRRRQPGTHEPSVGQDAVAAGGLLALGPAADVVDPQRLTGEERPGQHGCPAHRRRYGEVLPGEPDERQRGPFAPGRQEQAEPGAGQFPGGVDHADGQLLGIELRQQRRQAEQEPLQPVPLHAELFDRPLRDLELGPGIAHVPSGGDPRTPGALSLP